MYKSIFFSRECIIFLDTNSKNNKSEKQLIY